MIDHWVLSHLVSDGNGVEVFIMPIFKVLFSKFKRRFSLRFSEVTIVLIQWDYFKVLSTIFITEYP